MYKERHLTRFMYQKVKEAKEEAEYRASLDQLVRFLLKEWKRDRWATIDQIK